MKRKKMSEEIVKPTVELQIETVSEKGKGSEMIENIKDKIRHMDKRRVFLFIIFIFSLGYLLIYFYTEYRSVKLTNDLAEIHAEKMETTEKIPVNWSDVENALDAMIPKTVEEDVIETEFIPLEERKPLEFLPEMLDLFEINADTVGWITVGGTKINNVVVQGSDNDYYLHHDFNGKEASAGTIFADYRNTVSTYSDMQSDNIILYGHKQANGTMFGTLHNYNNDITFYKENPTFEFNTLYEKYTYKIVAMFVVATNEKQTLNGKVFDYQNYLRFKDKGDYSFANFISNIKSRSQLNIPVEIRPDDKFMTLSTCSYEFNDARFVVIGRRVRQGESLDINMDLVTVNKVSAK